MNYIERSLARVIGTGFIGCGVYLGQYDLLYSSGAFLAGFLVFLLKDRCEEK